MAEKEQSEVTKKKQFEAAKLEVLNFINDDGHLDSLLNLRDRWADEKEYEDWSDYETALNKMTADDWSFIRGSKRPFGFITKVTGLGTVHIFLKFKGDYVGVAAKMKKS